MPILARHRNFADDLGKINESVVTQRRALLLAVLGVLMTRPFVEPRETASLRELLKVLLSIAVADFLDFIEGAKCEGLESGDFI